MPLIRTLDSVQSKTSNYDRLSAALTSLVMLIGFVVTCLFLIWLTSVFNFDQRAATPFLDNNPGEDGNDKPEGFEDDELEPGVEDFPEIETPALAEALEAVSDAVSTVQANSEHVSGDAAVMGKGGGYGSRDGGPSGSGDGIPDYKRWKISFEVNDVETYKRLVDHFEIHVGVVSPDSEDIWRVSNVSGRAQVSESNRKAEAKILHVKHSKPRLRNWDFDIAKDAGVPISKRSVLVQFYTPALRTNIRRLEAEYLAQADRELRDVRKTFIRVEPTSGGFEFTIDRCEYR